MAQPFAFSHSVRCPRCLADIGRWCRDNHGKSIPPHPERRKEAIKIACGKLVHAA